MYPFVWHRTAESDSTYVLKSQTKSFFLISTFIVGEGTHLSFMAKLHCPKVTACMAARFPLKIPLRFTYSRSLAFQIAFAVSPALSGRSSNSSTDGMSMLSVKRATRSSGFASVFFA